MTKYFKKAPSYRLSHCGIFPSYELDGSPLRDKSIVYLVSVGKDKFEDKWATRFVNFIEEVKPKSVFIVVADTLQRFNIEVDENLSEKEALQVSRLRGESWIEKYKPYFAGISTKYEFICWDSLKKDEDYDRFYKDVVNMSIENDFFKKNLLISSEEYIKRPSRLNSTKELALEKSNEFLKEECAVLRILAKCNNTKAILYPGKSTDILSYAIQNINNLDRVVNKFHWIELRPTKCKSTNYKKEPNDFFLRDLPFFNSSIPIPAHIDIDEVTTHTKRLTIK